MLTKRQVAIVAILGIIAIGGFTLTDDTPAPEQPDTTPVPSVDNVSYPAGYASNGITNLDIALTTHNSTIATTGSYVRNSTIRTRTNVRTFTLRAQQRGTQDIKHLTYTTLTGADSDLYVSGADAYHREGTGQSATYRTVDNPAQYTEQYAPHQFREYLTNIDYTATDVTRDAGSTLIHYEATDFDTTDSAIADLYDYNSTLTVDTRGRIHDYSVSFHATLNSGATVNRTISVTYHDYGNTIVSQPNWVDDARQQTNA